MKNVNCFITESVTADSTEFAATLGSSLLALLPLFLAKLHKDFFLPGYAQTLSTDRFQGNQLTYEKTVLYGLLQRPGFTA